MTKNIFFTWMLAFTAYFAHGQDFSKEFGKIGKSEIELQQYSPDKNAEAVVLFDIGKSYFLNTDNSFDVIFERTTRIKILTEAGIKWAEVEIPYYQEGDIYEKVYAIEAYAYNYENGHLTKTSLKQSNIYSEKVNNYWKVMKFAIPNVKKGTIIEYKYKINSPYKFNLRDWAFQWKIPVVYSEYEVRMIPFYEYTWLLQGAKRFDRQTSYIDKLSSRHLGTLTFRDMVNKYIMENVPAFDNEEFITSINDYLIKLDFQLSKIIYPSGASVKIINTWEEMNKEFLKDKDFGKFIKTSEKLAAKLPGIEKVKAKSDNEKFNYALNYVKSNFNWNGNNSKYASKTPRKLLEEKYGNCADINLFTIGLLNALGIDAEPVLISTRAHGKIKYNYPYTHFFNYVLILARVDSSKILTDATEILNLNNRIPSRCINDKGLIVQKDKVEWTGLACRFPSEINTDIQTKIIDGLIMKSTVSKTATEYAALYYRKHYANPVETLKSKIENNGTSLIDSSINVQNQSVKEKPYILTYTQTSKPEIVNGKIYLSPFLDLPVSDNPLSQKERTYPVDMTYPKKRVFHAVIQIPEGYKAEYVPAKQKIDNALFALDYSATANDKQITLSFEYYFKLSVYAPKDYQKIKHYFNEIVKKGNEKVVLAKK